MPRSILVLCGMGIFLSNYLSGQSLQLQNTWQHKQMPVHIVSTNAVSQPPLNYQAVDEDQKNQAFDSRSDIRQFIQKYDMQNLHNYLQQDRSLYLIEQKESWYKDPSKAIGAGLLGGFFSNNPSVFKK